MLNATQAANWVVEFSAYESWGSSWDYDECLLNHKWAETPKLMTTASVWLAHVLVLHNQTAFWLCMNSLCQYNNFRRSFSEAAGDQGGGPAQFNWLDIPLQKEYSMLRFKRRFLDNTLFVIPHFAHVYLRKRTSYRNSVKCVVKRKKSVIISYAKLKI